MPTKPPTCEVCPKCQGKGTYLDVEPDCDTDDVVTHTCRECIPVPVVARPPQIECGALPDPSGLLAAIILNPDEDTPRLMYADWLDEHTELHKRADLIRAYIEWERMEGGILCDLQWAKCAILQHLLPQQKDFCTRIERGFAFTVFASWDLWARHGDEFRSREWVPLVKLTDRKPIVAGSAHGSVWLPGDPKRMSFPNELVGNDVLIDSQSDNTLLAVLTLRWPGTAFQFPS